MKIIQTRNVMAITTCLMLLCAVGIAGEKTPPKVRIETVIADDQSSPIQENIVLTMPPTENRFVNSRLTMFSVFMGRSKNNRLESFTNVDVPYDKGYDMTSNNVMHNETVFLKRRAPRGAPLLYTSILPPFQDDNGTLSSIKAWSEIVCASKSMCTTNTKCAYADCPKCSCVDDCSIYGDCCPELLVTNGLQTPMEGIHCISSSFITSMGSTEQWYLMMTTCPHGSSIGEKTRKKCENPNENSIEENRPVYSAQAQLHFRNIFCAQCHSVNDTKDWLTEPFCNAVVDTSYVTTLDELMTLIRNESYCGLRFQPQNRVHECTGSEADMVSRCNVTGMWDVDDYRSGIEHACRLILQPLEFQGVTFKNYFCAYCNGMGSLGRCKSFNFEPFGPPLSILFNFLPEQEVGELWNQDCRYDEMFDHVKNVCRKLHCNKGEFVRGHTCVDLISSANGLAYVLHYTLTPSSGRDVIADLDSLFQLYLNQASLPRRFLKADFTNLKFTVKYSDISDDAGSLVWDIAVQYAIVVGRNLRREYVVKYLKNFVTSGWNYQKGPSQLPLYEAHWAMRRNDFLELPIIKFENGQKNLTRAFTDIRLTSYTFPQVYRVNHAEYITIDELTLCDMVDLETEDWQMLTDGRVRLSGYGVTLDIGHFRLVENHTRLRVCVDSLEDKTAAGNSESDQRHLSDNIESFLTICCTSLSLICLLVSFLAYLFTPKRKTLPGVCSIFLFANLFLAQLLFLTGTTAVVSMSACGALGVIIHYFWLTSFCWKVVSAFHAFRVFTYPMKFPPFRSTVARYAAFAQLFPAALISTFILVHQVITNGRQIGYADRLIKGRRLCFLSEPLDVALGFALPVGIILLMNTYFMARFVHVMRSRPETETRKCKSHKTNLVIYFKMAVLFGLTWSLGFIAVAVNRQEMWYVFTAVNASVGVFVFWCFAVKTLGLCLCYKDQHAVSKSSVSRSGTKSETNGMEMG